jgi:hypothetical protein
LDKVKVKTKGAGWQRNQKTKSANGEVEKPRMPMAKQGEDEKSNSALNPHSTGSGPGNCLVRFFCGLALRQNWICRLFNNRRVWALRDTIFSGFTSRSLRPWPSYPTKTIPADKKRRLPDVLTHRGKYDFLNHSECWH